MKTVLSLAIAIGSLLGLLGVHLLAAGSTAVLAAGPVAGIALGVWSVRRQRTRITAALGFSRAFVLTLAARASGCSVVPVAPYAAASLAMVPEGDVALASPLGSLKAVRLRH